MSSFEVRVDDDSGRVYVKKAYDSGWKDEVTFVYKPEEILSLIEKVEDERSEIVKHTDTNTGHIDWNDCS